MVVNMYIISPKKDWFKLVFFSLFDFSKMKRPRPRLQKINKQSFLVLVLFGLSPVQLQSFASPRTGPSNTSCRGKFALDKRPMLIKFLVAPQLIRAVVLMIWVPVASLIGRQIVHSFGKATSTCDKSWEEDIDATS